MASLRTGCGGRSGRGTRHRENGDGDRRWALDTRSPVSSDGGSVPVPTRRPGVGRTAGAMLRWRSFRDGPALPANKVVRNLPSKAPRFPEEKRFRIKIDRSPASVSRLLAWLVDSPYH